MNTLKYNGKDEASVREAFEMLVTEYGFDKGQALYKMNFNPIAVENADAWMIDLQNHIAVFDTWAPGVWYTRGEGVTHQGVGYMCIQSHTSQAGWEPPAVSALFGHAPVWYPGENYAHWVQPLGSEDAYKLDDRVTHNSEDWESDVAANVWEPGVAQWTKLGGAPEEYPPWVQPTGAHDDYDTGAKVSHNTKRWTSTVDANVWEPGVFGWNEVP